MIVEKILFIIGTRPEAIKIAPLWFHLVKNGTARFEVEICVTGQHQEMLLQTLKFFNIVPTYNLEIMKNNQNLFDITSDGLKKLDKTLEASKPDLIFVQGDTTSAFIGALGGFYKQIKVAHIEAGLRTNNKYSPFPEEVNRVLVDHISDFHFAPTKKARENLLRENIRDNVWVVGNTVIDSLFMTLNIIQENEVVKREIINYFNRILTNWEEIAKSKIIFVTAHRRESFGRPFYDICHALREIALNYPEISIIYPVHLNPNVRRPVFEILNEIDNIYLFDPLDYQKTIWLMKHAHIVLTDSGGIQEEAPSLGKPVLVMRDVTERVEGIESGTARLVGSNKKKIVKEVIELLEDKKSYEKMSKANNPYGDGNSAMRIIEILGLI